MRLAQGFVLAVLSTLILATLAGCISEDAVPDRARESDVGSLSSRSVTDYLRNVSEPDPRVTFEGAIVTHLRVQSFDGTHLDTWVVRPDVEEPLPVVVEVTPYYGGGDPTRPELRDEVNVISVGDQPGGLGGLLVPRGYAFAVSSIRGTGNSEGCYTLSGPEQRRDVAAVVEHLASEPWSNGRVGLIGLSAPGSAAQQGWVEAPRGLRTIVPVSAASDEYKYLFVNGVPLMPQGYTFNAYNTALVSFSPAGASAGAQAYDPVNMPNAWEGRACPEQVNVQLAGVEGAAFGNKDAFWYARDLHERLREDWDKERASVFYVHGFQDWNVQTSMMEPWLTAVQETGVPFKAWLGQWGHSWPTRSDWDTVLVAWFDQWLKDVDTGVLDAPPVQVEDDRGQWRHERGWPPRDVRHVSYHPHLDGSLREGVQGSGSVVYHDHFGGIQFAGAEARVPAHEDRVVFVSDPLEEALHVAGLPRFEGNVTASGHRANLILTLAERSGDATDRAFNFAAQSLNHVEDPSAGRPDVSGLTQEVRVDFYPQETVLAKGSRIVLIAAANTVGGHDTWSLGSGKPGPSLQPVSSGSDITIDLSDARLILPVRDEFTFEDPQPGQD